MHIFVYGLVDAMGLGSWRNAAVNNRWSFVLLLVFPKEVSYLCLSYTFRDVYLTPWMAQNDV